MAVKLALPLGVGAVCVVYAMHGVDRHAVLAAVRALPVSAIALYLATVVVTNLFRAWRWEFLLRPFEGARYERGQRIGETTVRTLGGYVRAFEKKIDFAVAGNDRVEVKLDPGVTIRGRAKLPADVPTTGAEVSCAWSDRGRRAAPLLPSGEFEIRGVPGGMPLDFLVQTPYRPKSNAPWNFVPMPFQPLEVPAGLAGMTVDLDFVAATHVGVALSYPPSLHVDPWDMTAELAVGPEGWRIIRLR